jgi:anaerobic selenocysteine-containing dehydrogenase
MEGKISRRNFLKTSAIALAIVAISGFKGTGSAVAAG